MISSSLRAAQWYRGSRGHGRKWIYGREDIPGAKMSSNLQSVVVVNPKNVEKLRGKWWSTLNEMIIIIPLTTAWNFCYTTYTAHTACPQLLVLSVNSSGLGLFSFFRARESFDRLSDDGDAGWLAAARGCAAVGDMFGLAAGCLVVHSQASAAAHSHGFRASVYENTGGLFLVPKKVHSIKRYAMTHSN